MVDDLAPAARYLNATTDDTGPALLTALLLEVKTAKLVDLAPTGFATHDEELRSLLPPEWETAPGTLGPAATGPTATAAGLLRRSASGSAARGAWQPSDGPRLNARSPQQRKKGLHQNTRWGEGDQHEALRRLHPDRHPDRAEAVAHTHPRVVVHSVQYRGEAKAAPPHRNTAAHHEERSDPRPMVFNNPTVVASRILSEHARAVRESERKNRSPAGARHRLVGSTAQLHHLATPHRLASSQMMMMMMRARACGLRQAPSALIAPPTPRPSPQNNARVVPAGARRRPASARAAQRMPDDLATRMQEAGLPKRYLHALRGMGFVYVEQLLALGRSLSLTERYVEVSGGPRSCTAPPLNQVLDTRRPTYTLAALTTPATPHVLHSPHLPRRTYCTAPTAPTAPTRCSTRSTSRPDTACSSAAGWRGWQGTVRPRADTQVLMRAAPARSGRARPSWRRHASPSRPSSTASWRNSSRPGRLLLHALTSPYTTPLLPATRPCPLTAGRAAGWRTTARGREREGLGRGAGQGA